MDPGPWLRGPIPLICLKENNSQLLENPGSYVILQKGPSILFYLCFSPCNFTETTPKFTKIIFSSFNFAYRSLCKIYNYN
jgi:hypothetical protein